MTTLDPLALLETNREALAFLKKELHQIIDSEDFTSAICGYGNGILGRSADSDHYIISIKIPAFSFCKGLMKIMELRK